MRTADLLCAAALLAGAAVAAETVKPNILFVLSDLLIFARAGGAMAPDMPNLLVWPTYFAGQALIAWGVVSTLRKEGR